MSAYPTGFDAIDALPVDVAKHSGDLVTVSAGEKPEQLHEKLRQIVLFLAVEACDNGDAYRPGFVVSVPTTQVVGTQVVAVSPDVLAITKYDDKEAYQAALNAPDFVHPEDLLSASAHIAPGSRAPYKLRLKRGDNGEYIRVTVRGLTLNYLGTQYRITIIRREVP
jgi:hypothetical protein